MGIEVQAYLKSLVAAANSGKAGGTSLGHVRVAVRCLTGLLVSVPHFNYTSDLLQVPPFSLPLLFPPLLCTALQLQVLRLGFKSWLVWVGDGDSGIPVPFC
jgi:hypothetical protein